jgi:hypothetical protein
MQIKDLKSFSIAELDGIAAQTLRKSDDFSGPQRYVIYQEVVAARSPLAAAHPAVVGVPPGYGLYFRRAFNNGWTDNRDSASRRPLEGFDFEDGNEFVRNARRAELVGVDRAQGYLGYERSVDHSIPGSSSYYPNKGKTQWNLEFYMNDNLNYYGDNSGTANIDIDVFRL